MPFAMTSTDQEEQTCKTPVCQVTVATEFCTVAPNMFGSSLRNMLHVMLLAPRILRWLLDFRKNYVLLQ